MKSEFPDPPKFSPESQNSETRIGRESSLDIPVDIPSEISGIFDKIKRASTDPPEEDSLPPPEEPDACLLPKDYFDPSGLLKLNEKEANNVDDSDSDETSLSDVIMQHEKRVLGKKMRLIDVFYRFRKIRIRISIIMDNFSHFFLPNFNVFCRNFEIFVDSLKKIIKIRILIKFRRVFFFQKFKYFHFFPKNSKDGFDTRAAAANAIIQSLYILSFFQKKQAF